MAVFFNFSPTSNHLHPLQVENCDSNSRLVVDDDDNGKFGNERFNIGRPMPIQMTHKEPCCHQRPTHETVRCFIWSQNDKELTN